MSAERVHTGVRFDEETLNKITYIARKNCRSINAQLEFLAKQCIEEYEMKKGKIHTDGEQ